MEPKLRVENYDEANSLWLAARSAEATPEFLAPLALHKVWFVRRAVGGNKNTPRDVLGLLASDEDPSVRWSVAGNIVTRPETLKKLARDQDWDVRYSAAGNASTPVEELMVLSKDAKILVRFAVLGNPAVTRELLELLVKDENTNLSKTAKQKLEELDSKKAAKVKTEN